MGFQEAVKAFFSNYTKFSGRSSRSEYWWPQLFLILIAIVLGIIGGVLGDTIGNVLIGIFYLAIIIPAIAVGIRRLHDVDKSGWWMLLSLIPLVSLVLLFFFVQKGTDGPNQFGPDPLGGDVNVFN